VLTSDPSARSSRTSIFIVADVRLYREGLASTLATCSRLAVVGTCANRTDAREHVPRLHPDVVIVDVATRESFELIRDLRADAPRTKVLAFAVEENAADIIDCAESGAAGFVTSDASIDDLVTAIEGIVRAELVCSPRIAAQLFGRISERRQRWSFETKGLTSREREVLDYIRQGKSNKEIAQKLNIAEPTVKNHVHNLLDKLDVTTRAQAAARVMTPSSRRRASDSRVTG
jgi:two-component system, NarL family, nitrate/nitrite response regulator NarL